MAENSSPWAKFDPLTTTHFFCISNLVAKATDLNLGKKLSSLLSNHEALN